MSSAGGPDGGEGKDPAILGATQAGGGWKENEICIRSFAPARPLTLACAHAHIGTGGDDDKCLSPIVRHVLVALCGVAQMLVPSLLAAAYSATSDPHTPHAAANNTSSGHSSPGGHSARRVFHGVYDVTMAVEVVLLLCAVVIAGMGRVGRAGICGGGVCVERRRWSQQKSSH